MNPEKPHELTENQELLVNRFIEALKRLNDTPPYMKGKERKGSQYMKECKKCGAIIPDESKEMVCKECKEKTNKTIKMLAPIVFVATTAIAYVLTKGKTGGITAKQISDVTKDVVLASTKNTNPVFGGLSQSTLDNIAKDTYRGIKAVVKGDTLEYYYKSASGKTIHTAFGELDNAGKFKGVLGSGSNSPLFFFEKVLEKIQEIK